MSIPLISLALSVANISYSIAVVDYESSRYQAIRSRKLIGHDQLGPKSLVCWSNEMGIRATGLDWRALLIDALVYIHCNLVDR